jgi:hypothetical protein
MAGRYRTHARLVLSPSCFLLTVLCLLSKKKQATRSKKQPAIILVLITLVEQAATKPEEEEEVRVTEQKGPARSSCANTVCRLLATSSSYS